MRSTLYGFLVVPYKLLLDSYHMHSSLQFVTPKGIAPAFRRLVTTAASVGEITFLRLTRPEELGEPGKRHRFF